MLMILTIPDQCLFSNYLFYFFIFFLLLLFVLYFYSACDKICAHYGAGYVT